MMPRDAWEEEEAERQLEAIRRRRRTLEDFARRLSVLTASAPTGEARERIKPLAGRLEDLVRSFHMNNLDDMERLRSEIEELSGQP